MPAEQMQRPFDAGAFNILMSARFKNSVANAQELHVKPDRKDHSLNITASNTRGKRQIMHLWNPIPAFVALAQAGCINQRPAPQSISHALANLFSITKVISVGLSSSALSALPVPLRLACAPVGGLR